MPKYRPFRNFSTRIFRTTNQQIEPLSAEADALNFEVAMAIHNIVVPWIAAHCPPPDLRNLHNPDRPPVDEDALAVAQSWINLLAKMRFDLETVNRRGDHG